MMSGLFWFDPGQDAVAAEGGVRRTVPHGGRPEPARGGHAVRPVRAARRRALVAAVRCDGALPSWPERQQRGARPGRDALVGRLGQLRSAGAVARAGRAARRARRWPGSPLRLGRRVPGGRRTHCPEQRLRRARGRHAVRHRAGDLAQLPRRTGPDRARRRGGRRAGCVVGDPGRGS